MAKTRRIEQIRALHAEYHKDGVTGEAASTLVLAHFVAEAVSQLTQIASAVTAPNFAKK